MTVVTTTQFTDFVQKAGTPKLTVVKNIKNQLPYDPATDFWKPFRDASVQLLKSKKPRSPADWTALAQSSSDKKKAELYKSAAQGLRRYIGKQPTNWLAPPPATLWSYGGLAVRTTIELGVVVGGVPHWIKLHLKKDKLTKPRADVLCCLLGQTFTPPKAGQFGLLDVARAKFYRVVSAHAGFLPLLQGEASCLASIHASI